MDKNLNKIDDNKSENELKNHDQTEIGGPKGPEPTRYQNEWENKGRCIDFS